MLVAPPLLPGVLQLALMLELGLSRGELPLQLLKLRSTDHFDGHGTVPLRSLLRCSLRDRSMAQFRSGNTINLYAIDPVLFVWCSPVFNSHNKIHDYQNLRCFVKPRGTFSTSERRTISRILNLVFFGISLVKIQSYRPEGVGGGRQL